MINKNKSINISNICILSDLQEIIIKKDIKEIIDNNGYKIIYNKEKNDINNKINPINNKKNNPKTEYNIFRKTKSLKSTIKELINNKINISLMEKIKEFSKDKSQDNSSKLKQMINECFQNLYKITININNKIDISEKYTKEIITLICAIFPFLMKNQKEQILKINIQKELMEHLNKNLLLNNLYEKKNKIDILFNDIILSSSENDIKKEKAKIKPINKEIFDDIEKQKINILYSYKLYLFYKLIYGDNYKNDQIKLLSFNIKFFLSNYKIFNITYNEFINIYNDLSLMKSFYSTIYNNEIKEPYIIELKNSNIIYGEQKFKKNNNIYIDINTLFCQNENEIYDQILNENKGIIPHFYRIDGERIGDLINYSSFFIKKFKSKYIKNIFDLINIKNYVINNNFELYRKNLINLEKEIYLKGKEFLTNNKANYIISKYSLKKNEEKIFKKFSSKFNANMDIKYKNKYKLIPFGSITQFLSGDNSDLDLYLYIEELNFDDKIDFLEHAKENCKNLCGEKNVKVVISLRICVIKLKFEGNEIDLSITAFPPYIHSLLFRAYSLIDVRFPLIAISLKNIVKITNLYKELILNSFSWTTLLVLFLQDIIKPPVLPKLFSDKEINEIYYQTIEFGHKKNNKDKIFYNFFQSTIKEKIPIPDCLFKRDKVIKIYEKLKKNNYEKYGYEKNVMTCSELIFKFLEFIILCKFDTIYANCSIEKEGYFNMNDIKNFEINNNEYENEKYKINYYNYFRKKYIKFTDRQNNKKSRDGLILIRDPIDPHYNPGQTFRNEDNLEEFIKTIKYIYSNLIKYGSFEKLKEKLKIKEERKKNI